MTLQDLDTRMDFFAGMLSCCHALYLWTYDSGGHLFHTNCPHQKAGTLFTLLQQDSNVAASIGSGVTPIIVSNEIGMTWIVQPLFEDGEMMRLYVLGPLFVQDVAQKALEAQIAQHNLSEELRQGAGKFLHSLPVISLNRAFEYAIMLHYCAVGQSIQVSDLRYFTNSHQTQEIGEEPNNQHGSYTAEQEMLRMVREGDIEHLNAQIDRVSLTGTMGKLSNGDSLRQMKNAVQVGITLFSRAAIEGGLSPEISYTLTDYYFQSVEACHNLASLREISKAMQQDFVGRVHRCRTSGYSAQIRACCDYIEQHLEEDITLPKLAEFCNYSKCHLSHKFKNETGLSARDYIREKRLERAAFWLRTTQQEIQDISIRLQFASQSHFTSCFHKQYGQTPSAYRAGKSV